MHLNELQLGARPSTACSAWSSIDPLGHLLALAGTLATMITLGFARPYLASRDLLKGEFLSLAMFSLLGISVMVSANNFLVVYVGLELMSLSLYALTALRRDHAVSTEAAMKYFILGALACGLPAVRPVDDVRRHRHARHPDVFEAIHKGTRQPAGADLRPRVHRRRPRRSSWASRRSTCGCPTSTRARPRPSRC